MTSTENHEIGLITLTDTMAEVALKPLTRRTARLLSELALDVQTIAKKAHEEVA